MSYVAMQLTPDECRLIEEHRAISALETKTMVVPITVEAMNAVGIAVVKSLREELACDSPEMVVVFQKLDRWLCILGDHANQSRSASPGSGR